ncbi:MAG: pentapeptide repeat-containing protein [Desulfonatronovibrio sp.]
MPANYPAFDPGSEAPAPGAGKAFTLTEDTDGDGRIKERLLDTNECGECDLYQADLLRADLKGANLSGDDLSRVSLFDAILQEANLSGADLSGATLSGAIWTDGRRCAEGSIGECK